MEKFIKKLPEDFYIRRNIVNQHLVQMDAKVALLKDFKGSSVKRFQYTAIDDATRIRALQIYQQQNQANAIEFVNYVIKKFLLELNLFEQIEGMSSWLNFIGMWNT